MFSLNAWVERSRPYLELRNNHTEQVVLALEGEKLCHVLQDNGYTYDDFLDRDNSFDLIRHCCL